MRDSSKTFTKKLFRAGGQFGSLSHRMGRSMRQNSTCVDASFAAFPPKRGGGHDGLSVVFFLSFLQLLMLYSSFLIR